jgi:hypothetical protein
MNHFLYHTNHIGSFNQYKKSVTRLHTYFVVVWVAARQPHPSRHTHDLQSPWVDADIQGVIVELFRRRDLFVHKRVVVCSGVAGLACSGFQFPVGSDVRAFFFLLNESRELVFLLLSVYGATLGETDLEFFNSEKN